MTLDLDDIKRQVASEHNSYQWVVTTIVPQLIAEIEWLRGELAGCLRELVDGK